MSNHTLQNIICTLILILFACPALAQSAEIPARFPNTEFKDNNIEIVFVQGGTFTMGCTSQLQSEEDKFYGREADSECISDEIPAHKVTLSSYSIGKYEVTQAQWFAVMDENPSEYKDPKKPLEHVLWDDIVGISGTILYTEKGVNYRSDGFCGKLYQKTREKYRLPTEAEWEFAARGGNKSSGCVYSGSNDFDNVAWQEKNSGNQTHPVGQKQPNELGIYDMSGNVWEFCCDGWRSYSNTSQTNPIGTDKEYRVVRGGSWSNHVFNCTVSGRFAVKPDTHSIGNGSFGFRLALSSDK